MVLPSLIDSTKKKKNSSRTQKEPPRKYCCTVWCLPGRPSPWGHNRIGEAPKDGTGGRGYRCTAAVHRQLNFSYTGIIYVRTFPLVHRNYRNNLRPNIPGHKTLVDPSSAAVRFWGQNTWGIRVVCPQIETAVLDGLMGASRTSKKQ